MTYHAVISAFLLAHSVPEPITVSATTGADAVSTVVNKKRSSGITATNGKINNLLGFIPRAYKLYNTRVYPSILYEDLGNNVEHVTVCCFTYPPTGRVVDLSSCQHSCTRNSIRLRTPQLAESVRGGLLPMILVALLTRWGHLVISFGRRDRPFCPTPMICE
jgi:hypothetical protein